MMSKPKRVQTFNGERLREHYSLLRWRDGATKLNLVLELRVSNATLDGYSEQDRRGPKIGTALQCPHFLHSRLC